MWPVLCLRHMRVASRPLTPDEMQLGATVIDMGAGTTSIAVFLEGALVHSDVVPMGGALVTSDLARTLAAPVSAAERLKTLYGAALGDIESGTDIVTVPQMGEDNEAYAVRVPRSMLTRIIQPRLEEIFAEVQTRLRASGFDVAAGRRAVLTGGACQLAGMRELAQRVLNKQVRLGRPNPSQAFRPRRRVRTTPQPWDFSWPGPRCPRKRSIPSWDRGRRTGLRMDFSANSSASRR